MTFAELLKGLRSRAGQSQPRLAEASGVPVGTIRTFEQGRREPTFATLVKLARGLGVLLGDFDPGSSYQPLGEEAPSSPASAPPQQQGSQAGQVGKRSGRGQKRG